MKILLPVIAVLATALALSGGARASHQEGAAESHANRGVALLEQFRFAEAASEFETVVRLEPDSLPGRVNLGIAYFNERDFDKARAALEEAKRLGPESPYVHYNLGLIDKLQGRSEEAVAAFEKVAELVPEDPMTHYYLGTLYANLGRLEDAERSLRRALELQPNNESAHFSLGNVLVRQGRREEGQRELLIFRELKESFPAESASAGLQYTELGRFAEAMEPAAAPLQPVAEETLRGGAVRYVAATETAGLTLAPLASRPPLPESLPAADYGREWIGSRLLPGLGTGIAFRDLDGDGDPDLIFVRDGAPVLYLNAAGSFERAAGAGLPERGAFVGVVVGDADNDGDGDVYLSGLGPNALYLNDGAARFEEAADETVRGDDVSVAATFADVDHDGDLDIYVSNYVDPRPPAGAERIALPDGLPGAPNRLYRNNANGTFTEISEASRTAGGARRSLGAIFSDLDDDRDIDFLVVNDGSESQAFSNDRVGTFTERSRDWGFDTGARARGVDAGDFDRDGNFDLFVTSDGALLNLLFRGGVRDGLRADVLSPGLLAAGVPGPRYGTAFFDADNDGDLDLALVVNEGATLAALYENRPEGFVRSADLASEVAGEGRGLATADVDGDGDLDVVVTTDRGEMAYFRNDGGDAGHYLDVRAQGLRSNLDGLGAKVEVKAGGVRLRREVRSSSGYFSQSDLPLHFGLGAAERADYVRFLWPGGVKQVEMDVSAGRTARIEELDRKGTSCPILYAWDGEKIRFVTDFLGGSAYGYLLAPGVYNTPDTSETVKLERFPLVARDGVFDLRWVNQLEEALLYDKASLLVVDHPEGVEVFPNERLMPGPPYPEDRLYPLAGSRPVARATDERGRDVTELLREKDRRYPDDFALLPFKGYAEEHALTLDLGSLRKGASYVLLLYGWVDYADSTSNLAASQAGVALVPPHLEVLDERGELAAGLEQMGFPAGLPKTMLVDLSGLVGPDRRQVRITTNMRLYWDQILVGEIVPGADLRVHELAPREADLRFLGYPQPDDPDGRAPTLYTYDRIAKTDLWDAHEGDYTRYGDVRPLVESVDDRYVVTHHGDELRLTFDAKSLPALGPGWTRSYFVVADGFGKDMDLNSARPLRLEPLPFHGMSSYPYPEGETVSDPSAWRRSLEEYNTRHVGGRSSTETGPTP